MVSPPQAKVNYGLDAPDVVLRFFLFGCSGIVIGVFLIFVRSTPLWARTLGFPLASMGTSFLLTAMLMYWGSKVGKLRLRDQVLARVEWRGDERVLDVGCGHGLMLIGAARRIPRGKAIGVDLWQTQDQSGNSREATWHNVQLEGVSERVELQDGDARNLPFANGSFDVVVSSWALHNIYDPAGREKAIAEIVRVLKPGGRAAVIDIRHGREYEEDFTKHGMNNTRRYGPNFTFVLPSFTVVATKPA